MTIQTVELRESSDLIGEADQENPRVIKNVVLLGLKSRNGYSYSESALQKAVALYEGRHVYLDHIEKGQRRTTRDLAGHIKSPRFEEGKIRGDIAVLDTDAGRTFRGLFEGDLSGVGMSHIASGTKSKSGQIVESIDSVSSVDVVLNPASTSSFREGIEEPMNVQTLKEQHAPLVEEIATEARTKALSEAKAAHDIELKGAVALARKEAFSEGVKSEQSRQTTFRALCEEAGCGDLAESFLKEATVAVEDVHRGLKEALIKKNKAPKPGGDPLEEGKDENAKYRKEFVEGRVSEVFPDLTEEEFVASRRKDDGLPAIKKAP